MYRLVSQPLGFRLSHRSRSFNDRYSSEEHYDVHYLTKRREYCKLTIKVTQELPKMSSDLFSQKISFIGKALDVSPPTYTS